MAAPCGRDHTAVHAGTWTITLDLDLDTPGETGRTSEPGQRGDEAA